MTDKERLHAALVTVRDNPKHGMKGICELVERAVVSNYFREGMLPSQDEVKSVMVLMQPLYKKWGCYSGNEKFPVPAPRTWSWPSSFVNVSDKRTRANKIFHLEQTKGKLWDGKYGGLRRVLLDYLIERTSC